MGIVSKVKALELARQEFQKETGQNLENYEVTLEDSSAPDVREWVFSFKRKYNPPTPRPVGGPSYAYVDKNTGKVVIRAGD